MKLRLRGQKENLVYLALWLVLFAAPVLNAYIRSASGPKMPIQWSEILHVWSIYAIYLVIFLLHNFVLAPLLIYKHKKSLYFATTGCLILVFVLFNCIDNKPRDLGPREPRPREEFRKDPPPMFEDDGERPADFPPMMSQPPMLNEGDVVNAVFLILLLGMNLGVKLYLKSDNDREQMQELERQNMESQLEYLKYQINPHFFMNTLNNIHALVDIEPEQAKKTIVDLSKLMRYVLYEGTAGTVPLSRDLDFIDNYVKLMRLRYSDRVSISIQHPSPITHSPSPNALQIPPMLLITFVENAFKHGVSYRQDSFIDIETRVSGDRLTFRCRNSKQVHAPQLHRDAGGGVGLSNVRQRLALLYGDAYTLDINDGDDTYDVYLNIPLRSSFEH